MTLLRESGAAVVERRLHRSEIYVADEVLLYGTAATVAPVTEVDGRQIGQGKPGGATRWLRDELWVIGQRISDTHTEWTTPVYGKE